jgi:hypothetical protein
VLYFHTHCTYQWQFLDDLSLDTFYFHVAVWGGSCIQSQHQQLEYEMTVNPFCAVTWNLGVLKSFEDYSLLRYDVV